MNFVSLGFLVFVAFAFALYWRLPGATARKLGLTLASYAFYAAWDWRCCGLMLLVTGNAWATGRLLPGLAGQRRRHLLLASVGLNLMVLAIFKYWGFFAENLAALLQPLGLGSHLLLLQVVLPVGISFYSFHAISYVMDVHRGKLARPAGLLDVALYIAFFPQLIAGPIVRAAFFLPQLSRPVRLRWLRVAWGLRLFLRGLLYKAVLAEFMAQLADPVFADVTGHGAGARLTAGLAFYGQIYFDFAGYSLMAIGTARLFGYRLPRNFNYPYAAASVTEFWRRWHMSLSLWIRDYVYLSLGGNRGGRMAVYRNLMLAMLLGGLWHGAAWTFVLWGGLHGLALCVHKLWRELRQRLAWPGFGLAGRLLGVALTQAWVAATFVVFRSNSLQDAWAMLGGGPGLLPAGDNAVPAMAGVVVLLVLAVDHLAGSMRGRAPARRPASVLAVWFGLGVLLALVLTVMPLAQRPFIYFQF